MTNIKQRFLTAVAGLALVGGTVGCSTNAGTGALIGAGTGAGLGAIIGNNSHHHTAGGAAIGAGVGAAAGTGVVMATRGDEVRLAEGTSLTVALASPLKVRVLLPR